MLNQPTIERLQVMKLHGMAEAFQEQIETADSSQLSFEERFGLLVDRQWTWKEGRALTRRLQLAKFKERGVIEDINYQHPRGLDRKLMRTLATSEWVRLHHNVLLVGQTGIGKTWLACALAHKACRDGFFALHKRMAELFRDLAAARADGSIGQFLLKLARIDVLVLDDFAMAPLKDHERRDFLEICDDRYQRRSTILTSQLPIAHWHEQIGDPTIADSIMDRLVHNAYRIELSGESMRKQRGRKPDPELPSAEPKETK
jgi:DNA replication protein DnaC